MNKGWQIKKLGDLCDILDNMRKPITKRYRKEGIYPYYGATGILSHINDYLFDEKLVLVGEDGAKWSSGESTAFAVEGRVWVNNHAHVLRPHRDKILDYWLIHFFYYSDLSEYVSGMTVPKLNQGNLRTIAIPLPPPLEQQRIINILDDVFESIAQMKANTEKNLKNARELFENYLNSVYIQPTNGWTKKRLDQIGITQTGTTPKTSKRENYGDFIPFIKPGDFYIDGSLNYKNNGLTEEGLLEARKIASGSVLMVCIGATIGKCGYCDFDITTNQQINTLTPFIGILNKFIYYQMLTKDFQRRILLNSGQATLSIINKSKWNSLTVILPKNLQEQRKIVQTLDLLNAEIQRLETIYKRKLVMLDELKKSLLHQAFTGNL